MRTVIPALGCVEPAAALVAGCGFAGGLNTAPTVCKDALQTEIAARLTNAGEHPQSVTCKEDLVGEVGRTAHCDVVLSPTNSFEPDVTVTGVDGATIDYEMTPAVSKEQRDRLQHHHAPQPAASDPKMPSIRGVSVYRHGHSRGNQASA